MKVLLRAHGEPPETYRIARENGIEIIDATCPVVLMLQKRIRRSFEEKERPQIVIYGKVGHAEVNGLVGQTDGEAIVVEGVDNIDKIDFSRDVVLYSQTTKSLDGLRQIEQEIARRKPSGGKPDAAHAPVRTGAQPCAFRERTQEQQRNDSL